MGAILQIVSITHLASQQRATDKRPSGVAHNQFCLGGHFLRNLAGNTRERSDSAAHPQGVHARIARGHARQLLIDLR